MDRPFQGLGRASWVTQFLRASLTRLRLGPGFYGLGNEITRWFRGNNSTKISIARGFKAIASVVQGVGVCSLVGFVAKGDHGGGTPSASVQTKVERGGGARAQQSKEEEKHCRCVQHNLPLSPPAPRRKLVVLRNREKQVSTNTMPKRGRRRKKTRTHVVPPAEGLSETGAPIPKTLVVKRGRVGHAVESLVTDLRTVLRPNTAMKLKERKRGTLKDYVSVAGPLGITHMLMLSKTDSSVNLRIGRVPRGPTLTFKVESYVLGTDVRASQKRPSDFAQALQTSPLVVLNNFNGEGRGNHLKLIATTFQNIFPTINVQTVRLTECQRVVLLNYNEQEDSVEFRHYFIRPTASGVSRSVKRVAAQSRIPNLSHLDNIAEYVLGNDVYGPGGGAGSGTDSEGEDDSNKVTLSQDLRTRGSKRGAQSAIRLAEIGPRMTLKLAKVESGLAEGDVLFHAFVKKTTEESKKLKRKHKEMTEGKTERRRQQEENVEVKKQKLAEKKRKKLERRKLRREALEAAEELDGGGGGGGEEEEEGEKEEGAAAGDDRYESSDEEE
jgi:ribosome biogenesis protein SSF1/2